MTTSTVRDKCGENKLFYIDCEEEEEQEQEPSQDEKVEEILSEELIPTISLLKPSILKDTSKRKR